MFFPQTEYSKPFHITAGTRVHVYPIVYVYKHLYAGVQNHFFYLLHVQKARSRTCASHLPIRPN